MELLELLHKLVMNQQNGEKLGYIVDFIIDFKTATIQSIILSKNKPIYLFSKHNLLSSSLITIPWQRIVLIKIKMSYNIRR